MINKNKLEHIHCPDDGRGRRRVFINNKEIHRCFYANIKKGTADIYRTDNKGLVILDKHKKRILSKRLYGKIEIIPIEENNNGTAGIQI
jgi:hypothetical protein